MTTTETLPTTAPRYYNYALGQFVGLKVGHWLDYIDPDEVTDEMLEDAAEEAWERHFGEDR